MKKINTQYLILTTLFKLFMVQIRSNLVLLLRSRRTNQVIHFLSNRKRGSNFLCDLICWKHPKVTIRVSTTKVKKLCDLLINIKSHTCIYSKKCSKISLRMKITILSIFSLENTQDRDFLFIFWKNWGHNNLLSRLSDL